MRPFVPQPLPRDDLDWGELVPLIAQASRAIARFDGIAQGLVDPSVLLSPLVAREAVLSSMIVEIVNASPAEVPRRVELTVQPSMLRIVRDLKRKS